MKEYIGTFEQRICKESIEQHAGIGEVYPLFEIGGKPIRPDNLDNTKFDIKNGHYIYTFTVNGYKYAVVISTFYDKSVSPYNISVKIDFAAMSSRDAGGESYTSDMTNRGTALTVISAVSWVASFFFISWVLRVKMQHDRYASFSNANLVTLVIHAKSEVSGDMRRNDIYETFLLKAVERLGLNVTRIRQEHGMSIEDDKSVFVIQTEYDINPTPMTVVADRMRRGDNSIIESLSLDSNLIRMWALWSDNFYDGLFMNVSNVIDLTRIYRTEFIRYANMHASDELLRALKYFFNYRKSEIEKAIQ